jgi:hypothetical protein
MKRLILSLWTVVLVVAIEPRHGKMVNSYGHREGTAIAKAMARTFEWIDGAKYHGYPLVELSN